MNRYDFHGGITCGPGDPFLVLIEKKVAMKAIKVTKKKGGSAIKAMKVMKKKKSRPWRP